jgi:hypothetical protein
VRRKRKKCCAYEQQPLARLLLDFSWYLSTGSSRAETDRHAILGIAAIVIGMGSAKAADNGGQSTRLQGAAIVESWGGFYLGAGLGFRASDSSVNVNSATDTTLPAVLQKTRSSPRIVWPACRASPVILQRDVLSYRAVSRIQLADRSSRPWS